MVSMVSVAGSMSHREKVAWLSLLAMGIAFGPYFVLTGLNPPPADALPNVGQIARFGAAVAVQLTILGVGHLVLRMRWPGDARVPADERDRAIERHSMRVAYFVLIAGVIVVGIVLPFMRSGWAIVNGAVAAIIAAEVVQHGVAVRSYRRGWHD